MTSFCPCLPNKVGISASDRVVTIQRSIVSAVSAKFIGAITVVLNSIYGDREEPLVNTGLIALDSDSITTILSFFSKGDAAQLSGTCKTLNGLIDKNTLPQHPIRDEF